MTNYVYLIKCEDNNEITYKIGYSKNPEKRIKELETANPGKLTLIQKKESLNVSKLEKYLHRCFSYTKKNGEWFYDVENFEELFLKECSNFERNLKLIQENTTLTNKQIKFII